MHQNRIDYSLEEYQEIIKTRWHTSLLWLSERNPDGHRNLFFARPVPRTVWLPGKPRQKYYKKLFFRLHNQLACSDRKYSFATLTYSTKQYSNIMAAALLSNHIKEFIRLIRKRYKKVQYFWIIELTKNYQPHIHIIFDCFIHWKVLRAIWRKVTGSYITNIKSIPSSAAAGYITGYLTKQSKQNNHQFEFIFKHIDRLYCSSRNFFFKSDKILSKYILIAFSKTYFSDSFIFRPDPESELWSPDINYWYGLLLYDIFIHRSLKDSKESFNARTEILSYFQENHSYYLSLISEIFPHSL